MSQPKECINGCHYKLGSEYSYYTNCTDGSKCALENELATDEPFSYVMESLEEDRRLTRLETKLEE